MRRLWPPLPLEHERTKEWIRACFAYFAKGWQLADSAAVADLEFKGTCASPDEIKETAADLGADDLPALAEGPVIPNAAVQRLAKDLVTELRGDW